MAKFSGHELLSLEASLKIKLCRRSTETFLPRMAFFCCCCCNSRATTAKTWKFNYEKCSFVVLIRFVQDMKCQLNTFLAFLSCQCSTFELFLFLCSLSSFYSSSSPKGCFGLLKFSFFPSLLLFACMVKRENFSTQCSGGRKSSHCDFNIQ